MKCFNIVYRIRIIMIFRVFNNDLFIYEFLRILCEKKYFINDFVWIFYIGFKIDRFIYLIVKFVVLNECFFNIEKLK